MKGIVSPNGPSQVLYSCMKFGELGLHFIVAVVSSAAFQDCTDMKLPCYNATPQVRLHSTGNV